MLALLSEAEINPLNAELNPTCHLLVLLAHPILHISRIRVNVHVMKSQENSNCDACMSCLCAVQFLS
jgi:hypothetical protein